jgi:rubrerythrin
VEKDKKVEKARKKDGFKRNAEMAEGQSPEMVAKILQRGNKYYCAECNSELPMHTDCPSCHAHIDWDRIRTERGI